MSSRIYLSPPHMSGKELVYIHEAFDSNWIAPLGPNVDFFEQEVSQYVGVNHGLALTSGTAGIHLALKYLGVGEGDYVFCSDLTFAGSSNPIMYEKAIPIFVDSEPQSWNMSPLALEKAFSWARKENKMPKAIIIVDLYGQSADYDKLLPLCEYYKVPVIEDSAEALGASYFGRKCGSFGYINVFSFNGNKIITTSGGGLILSDDEDAVKKMRFWSTQAREAARHYEHKEVGYNYRMSNICAGIGRAQLEVLHERITAKKLVNQRYKQALADLPVSFMPIPVGSNPNYWLSVMTIDKNSPVSAEDLIDALEKENIESRPVWKPMHMQPVFHKYIVHNHSEENIGMQLYNVGVCLPSGSSLNFDEQEKVIRLIKNSF